MAVLIKSVEPNSPSANANIPAGGKLISINRREIVDVLDYRFYQNEKKLVLAVEIDGKIKKFKIK